MTCLIVSESFSMARSSPLKLSEGASYCIVEAPFGCLGILTELVEGSLMLSRIDYLPANTALIAPQNQLAKEVVRQCKTYFKNPHWQFDLPTKPLLWFINSFVSGLMRVSGLQSSSDSRAMSKEELRSLVLESNRFVSNHHRNILLNLFNLENITVDDVMTPRSKIEVLDLSRPIDEVIGQLETCYHNKLPVCDGDSERIVGILSVKKALSLLGDSDLKHEDFRSLLNEPYFIPSGTPVLQQMQFFQDNQQRLSLVVNEYGEVLGLVTFEDIVEELIGEFTTSFSNLSTDPRWLADGTYLATGSASLRDLNRLLNLNLPLDGPRTLNGLILEKLEAIPDHDVSIRIAGIIMEIVQFDEHGVKTIKLYRPANNQAQEQD
jgi:Mg2+/Co2+ transporter CorB